jgi:LEA14-like dessication related protein
MKRVLVVAVVSLSPSCALLEKVVAETMSPPVAVFGGERVGGASLDQATLNLSFVVTNPNPATLEVDGKPVDVSAPAAGLRIAPNSRATLDFSARVRFRELGLLERPGVVYRAQGSLSFSTPLGPSTLPVEHSGTLDVPRPPEVAVALPRLTGLGLEGVALEVPVQVKNINPFPLSFTLQGSLEVGPLAKVATATAAEERVGAGETRQLGLPAQVLFQAVAAAASAFRDGSAKVVFEGALRSGEVTVPLRFTDAIPLPRLALKGVGLSELSLEGATAVVTVTAENPLPIAIDLGPSRLSVSLDGNKVAEMQQPPATRLAAAGPTEIQLPVRFGFGSLLSAAVAMGQPRTARVRVEGSLVLPTPVGIFQVPVDETRPLELPRLPELTFSGVRLASLSLTSATLSVEMTLVNRNAFAISAVRASGALALAGVRLGEISSGELGEVEAGGTRKLNTLLTVDFLRTAAAAQAVRSGTVSVGFDGSVASGAVSAPLKWAQTVPLAR